MFSIIRKIFIFSFILPISCQAFEFYPNNLLDWHRLELIQPYIEVQHQFITGISSGQNNLSPPIAALLNESNLSYKLTAGLNYSLQTDLQFNLQLSFMNTEKYLLNQQGFINPNRNHFYSPLFLPPFRENANQFRAGLVYSFS